MHPDTRHNVIQDNDTRQMDNQGNGTWNNAIQNNDAQHNAIHGNDIQQNDTKCLGLQCREPYMLNVTLFCCYAMSGFAECLVSYRYAECRYSEYSFLNVIVNVLLMSAFLMNFVTLSTIMMNLPNWVLL